jgi:hypothetical protein
MSLLKIKKTSGTIAIWKSVIDLIISGPVVLVPFCLLAVVETITLYILACSPHFPVNIILAPPIRNIWGQIYLHYPFIYELLPRMFYYAKLVLGVLIGSITSGMAVLIVFHLKNKEAVDLKKVFSSVLKRYVSLFILTLLLYASAHYLMHQPSVLLLKYFRVHRKLLFLGPMFWFNMVLPVGGYLMTIVFQALFVYAVPYIVLKGKKFLAALVSGIGLFFKLALKTLLVIIVPMLLFIPITMMKDHMAFLADRFGPEAIGVILFIGVLVGTIVVDALVTVATTLFFIEATHEK